MMNRFWCALKWLAMRMCAPRVTPSGTFEKHLAMIEAVMRIEAAADACEIAGLKVSAAGMCAAGARLAFEIGQHPQAERLFTRAAELFDGDPDYLKDRREALQWCELIAFLRGDGRQEKALAAEGLALEAMEAMKKK